MIELRMIGWKKGLLTISLIQLTRKFSTTKSLVTAKADIEKLLDGEVVVLAFPDEEARNMFKKEAIALGAIVE